MIELVIEYIQNTLSEKREEFSNKAVCPFAKPELDSGKLMISFVGDKGLGELIDEFHFSKYESALFIINENVPAEQTLKFQLFINRLLRIKGLKQYKNICFNPNDNVSVAGFNPRSKAPYFLINVAQREVLANAQKSLKKTNYYDNLPDEYLKFLKTSKPAKNKK